MHRENPTRLYGSSGNCLEWLKTFKIDFADGRVDTGGDPDQNDSSLSRAAIFRAAKIHCFKVSGKVMKRLKVACVLLVHWHW